MAEGRLGGLEQCLAELQQAVSEREAVVRNLALEEAAGICENLALSYKGEQDGYGLAHYVLEVAASDIRYGKTAPGGAG